MLLFGQCNVLVSLRRFRWSVFGSAMGNRVQRMHNGFGPHIGPQRKSDRPTINFRSGRLADMFSRGGYRPSPMTAKPPEGQGLIIICLFTA